MKKRKTLKAVSKASHALDHVAPKFQINYIVFKIYCMLILAKLVQYLLETHSYTYLLV